MSNYLSFYRKYRPSTFSQVIEQQNIVQVLETSVAQKQINHAYLFVGEKGTGKTSVARIFAKAVNCLDIWNQAQMIPCNKCEICIAINNHNILDIVEIDAASYNGVDDIRSLINNSIALPLITTYKVFIIDEAHMLTTFAFNALLKTLEEPPKHLIFILATTKPEKIPLTIFSRCQQFTFKKINTPAIITTLQNICTKENILYSDQALAQIAHCADGSLRDALSMLEQTAILSKNNITLQNVLDQFALLSNVAKINFLASLSKHKLADILHEINIFYERGINIVQLTHELIIMLKDILFIKKTADVTLSTILTTADIDNININGHQAMTMIDLLLILNEKLKTTKNSRIFFELYMFKIVEILQQPSPIAANNAQPAINYCQQTQPEQLFDDLLQTSFIKEEVQPSISDHQSIAIDNDEPALNETLITPPLQQYDELNYEAAFFNNQSTPPITKIDESLTEDFDLFDIDQPAVLHSTPNEQLEINDNISTNSMTSSFIRYDNDLIQINQFDNGKPFPIVFEPSKRDIINVILQSTIKHKETMMQLITSLQTFLENTQYLFIKHLLTNVNVGAACDEAIILTFPTVTWNELKTYHDINQDALLRWAFKTEVIVYCLWETDWFNYRNDFYKLKQSNKLPEPFNITNNYRNR